MYAAHFEDVDDHFVVQVTHKLKADDVPTVTLASASFLMTIFRSLARDDCAGISDSVRTFLSKYDEQGLVALGFESFAEACSVLGLALNVPLAILKNHRNELDPSFPNRSRA